MFFPKKMLQWSVESLKFNDSPKEKLMLGSKEDVAIAREYEKVKETSRETW